MILNAVEGKPLPVYGKGENVRDWLYVEDHACALCLLLENGRVARCTTSAGITNKKTLTWCVRFAGCWDELMLESKFTPHRKLINLVTDRPGHDQTCAIDAGKIQCELGWVPQETFASGLRKTLLWYLENREWCGHVQDG